MKTVIFSKYNRTRKKEYRICTVIFEQDGIRKVEKRPLCAEAREHVAALGEKSQKAEGIYTNISVLQPEITGEKASYPYLEGRTADSELRAYLGQPVELIRRLEEKNTIFFETAEGKACVFQETEAFSQVFGKQKLNGETAVCPANVDMLYDNLIWADGKYYCMDCEWVFDFPVPVSFLKFRSLYYFYIKYSKRLGQQWDLGKFLGCFQIDTSKKEMFLNMEEHFQKYVRGENFENDERKDCEKAVLPGEDLRNISSFKQRILQLQEEVEERNCHLHRLDDKIELLDRSLDNKSRDVQEKETQICKLSGDIAYLNDLAHAKDAQLADQVRYSQELEQIIAQIRRNPAYRISRVPVKIVKSALPKGSRRRKILGYMKRGMLHPVQACRKLSGGSLNRMYGDLMLGEGYKVHGRVEFPYEAKPQVSIVIPVYNQVCYTYNCLLSIWHNTKDVPYEVIVADDVSSDATKKLHSFTRNLVISRNRENLGFLKNCNEAAKKARGDYILFLNNDTTVGENWLKPLVDLMEKRPEAGLVGSKLIYPDGRLQEAGGIIWKDGSGWNYGREQDPNRPEYNYVKEVDYISGAAIMIRAELWKKIGGFDERFAPAYCEDSDLAFQVRAHGYQVLYQPLSVVTHYEGVSNGTDLTSGLKKYQVDNTIKFKEKWKAVLQEEQADSPEYLFAARDRSQRKRVVLFIDHYVPHFDQDAGSRTTFAYIKMFLKLGYAVKFIGDNYYRHEPYTTVLQQMGVEVLYGEWYALHWREWVLENSKFIDIAFMERPHITIKYIDYFREHTSCKVIYYGHDLHYMREMREYELTNNEETLRHARQMEVIEYEVMRKSDVVYYPSYLEIQEIARRDPSIYAKAVPGFLYERNEIPCLDIKQRKNIMFVGGFAHGPNVDAVKWFAAEIFPSILEKYPNLVFYIVGSSPTEEILALASDNIVVKGFVSDEELECLYRECRMAIVPLRYGAGMKGKVIEALYNKIPVVTTPIGAEGLEEYKNVLNVCSSAQEFAKCVEDLYEDYAKLERMISCMPDFIEKYFSLKTITAIISRDIE